MLIAEAPAWCWMVAPWSWRPCCRGASWPGCGEPGRVRRFGAVVRMPGVCRSILAG